MEGKKEPFKNKYQQLIRLAHLSPFINRFFIGYWILKTGLDFYPGPFFFFAARSNRAQYSPKAYFESFFILISRLPKADVYNFFRFEIQ